MWIFPRRDEGINNEMHWREKIPSARPSDLCQVWWLGFFSLSEVQLSQIWKLG